MFTKRIIPCLDVKDGRVVKGVNFVGLKDAGDPVEIAKAYDAAGADELIFLDITASSDSRNIVVDMVRRVAQKRLNSLADRKKKQRHRRFQMQEVLDLHRQPIMSAAFLRQRICR